MVLGGSESYLLVEPAALYHWGIEVPLDGVGPLAKVVDLLGGGAGRLSGRRRARRSDPTMFTTMRITSSQVLHWHWKQLESLLVQTGWLVESKEPGRQNFFSQ